MINIYRTGTVSSVAIVTMHTADQKHQPCLPILGAPPARLNTQRTAAFTLVELLVVTAIIVVLAAL